MKDHNILLGGMESMESKIHFILEAQRATIQQSVFGYATKGVPGLEVFGLGKYGRTIKEKFIYLTKNRNLKLSLKRYVVGVDLNQWQKDLAWEELKWIELPMLLVYWHLAEILPILKLDDCLTAGTVDVRGVIQVADFLKPINDLTLIGHQHPGQKIEISELISEISDMTIAEFRSPRSLQAG